MIIEALLSAYLLWLCGTRALRLWSMAPIDLVALTLTFCWTFGALAALALLLLAVF